MYVDWVTVEVALAVETAVEMGKGVGTKGGAVG